MTGIEWTEKVPRRIRATAAARLGVTLDEYDQRRANGQKWCGGCRAWQKLDQFATDRSRGDGLSPWCRESKNARSRESHVPAIRAETGQRRVDARPDDRLQARRRVNYLVDIGRLPRPNTLPCVDCGHVWAEGERRHEYDHHLGYSTEHHEDVEPVCTSCHHTREVQRRAAA